MIPHMQKTATILRYSLIALVVLIVIGLAWWYFFLNSKGETVRETDAGRGAGQDAPSFGSAIGSTYDNILSSLATLAGNADGEGTTTPPRLLQVSKTPTAGLGFTGSGLPAAAGATQAGASTALRFVERSTGYVLEVAVHPADGGAKSGVVTRLTNTLIPRVYEAKVSRDGRVIERFLDGTNGAVATILGNIPAASTTAGDTLRALTQTRLPDDIRSIAFGPDGKELFYITSGETGGAVGVRVNADGAKPQKIFSSSILGWHAEWLRDGRIILVQNASDGVPGYAYELGKSGSLSPLVAATQGLTLLPRPSSSALVFGASSGSSLTLYAQLDKKSSLSELPLRTIADKCVWSPSEQFIVFCAVPQRPTPANFLDLWHRGEVHTADAWWRVDMSAGRTELLYSPGDIMLDVENPAIDGEGEYIAFMNAADKSLWLLRINE